MSQLIKLSCECYVAADLVAEVKMNSYANCFTVRMKDGIGHSVSGGYKEMDEMIQRINKALACSS